jgi:hypothetical protein
LRPPSQGRACDRKSLKQRGDNRSESGLTIAE